MQTLSIQNRKGLTIVLDVAIPSHSRGLAFVEHGLGGFRKQDCIQTIAHTLFDHGYTVVNFDATHSIGESGGEYEQATMQNHYEDLVDVIIWAKTQDWYQEPFVLAGHSLGGYAVARYTEENPFCVKAVFPFGLVVSGALSLEAAMKYRKEETDAWKESGWLTMLSISKPGLEKRLPWSHMEERLHHNLIPHAGKLTMPILFVVGEEDKSCPPDQEKMFCDLAPGTTEFHIVAGAPHTFRTPEHLEVLRTLLSNWLATV